MHGNPARGILAFEAMQQSYFVSGADLYRGEPYAFLWPFSQTLAATVTLAQIPSQRARFEQELHVRLAGLSHYWQPTTSPPSYASAAVPPLGPGGDSFYDDNEWVGLELVRAYELQPEPQLLSQAQQIMNFVIAGWQSQPELPCAGGVPFSTAANNTDRNTITDGPGAELGVRLYQLTGNSAYLQFAERAYEWVRQCLLESNGLYADHIETSGTIDHSLWSYNQGVMIGAGVLLYQATQDGMYLAQARHTAAAALTHFTLQRLDSEVPFFVSIYMRNLLYLDSVTHDPPGAKLAQEYVNHAWQHRVGGVFLFGSPPGADLLGQAAIVQVYGLLSTPPKTYF
ncbi:MAG: glycoside hydrolase family 76 protein [Solirubrobacterales bacterium]|nr:glycoside hydrolase family 76 protein [Solirubrobacterales bacterium]